MNSPLYQVSPRMTVFYTRNILQNALEFRDHKRVCSAAMIWSMLIAAAARNTSLHQIVLLFRCCAQATLLKAIRASLGTDLREVEARINRALAQDLPRRLQRTPQILAIDLTLKPYHGQPRHHPEELRRGKNKSGTHRFHAYATVCVCVRGQRWTLAVTVVEQSESLADVVKRLMQQISRLNVKTRVLLLDREFCHLAVIQYLQRARRPFLMPMTLRGRKPDDPKGPTSTNVFAAKKRGGFFRYQMKNKSYTQKATLGICVRIRHKPSRRVLVYGYWGFVPPSTSWVEQTYRKRWGIETSYRQLYQGCPRTSTRDPILRLLHVGLSLVLRNVWVWLHDQVLSRPRRGGRVIDEKLLFYVTLLTLMEQEIDPGVDCHRKIVLQRPLPASWQKWEQATLGF